MSAAWPAPTSKPPAVTGQRARWAWIAFAFATASGLLVAALSLASWFIWTVGCELGDRQCTDVWLWVLGVIALLANVLPTVGILLADQRSGPLPYLLMLVPAPMWVLTFTVILP